MKFINLKIILLTANLLVVNSAIAASCALSTMKGFHISGDNLCLGKINYPEIMAAKSKLDINSFALIDDRMVLFTSESLIGTALMLGTPDGIIKIAGEIPNNDLKKNINDIRNVSFDSGDNSIYFMTSAWATSGAIHKINWDKVINVLNNIPVTSDDIEFITDGNSLYVIKKGKYSGYLIVNKHKYKDGGGSYDTYVLVSPKGNPVKEISEYTEDVNEFLSSSGTMERLR